VAVDREKLLQAAQKLVEKKRYDKAIVEYQKLVVDDPKDVRTLLKIGDLHVKIEQYVDAIATYERVGQFYSTQGFHTKTIAVYKQIREIVHKHVPHLEERFGHIVPKLAETYVQLGLVSDALAAYDEVATRYQRAGRDRDAIDVFRKVVELDPQNPLPHLRLAEAFMRVKDVDSAIQRFGAAAEILVRLGRRDDALKVLERLLQHRADSRFARAAAEIYLDRGEAGDAMSALAKIQICFRENPKDLDTLALLARSFDKLGQPVRSIEVQKEAARIAKEAGKLEDFHALVDALVARAPADEGVRQLAAQQQATTRAPADETRPAAPAARLPQPSVVLEVEEEAEVVLDDEEEGAVAEPFSLKAQASPPAPPARPVAPVDPVARARQILQQVDAHRHAKDYDHAITKLFEGIEELPAARELREKLCDVYIEAGDQAEAVRQMLAFARWLTETGDVERATRILDEVLLLEPTQAEAIALLRDLGYTVGEEAAPEPQAYTEEPVPSAPYDPQAPLPSYDLEEVSAVDAMGRGARIPHAPLPDRLDDPFAETPLPSFDLEDDATRYAARESAEVMPPPVKSGTVGHEGWNGAAASATPYQAAQEAQDGAHAQAQSGQLDEEALEEVEFFASNNMFDEARNLLEAELTRLPNHPLLLERLRELEEHAATARGGGSGTRVVPKSTSPASHAPEDRSFDIAASLDALDALDAGPQAAPAEDPSQVSAEDVFEQFKAGVAAQISESDAATHYDLGAAYKEMGLLTDAIGEFELAARDPGRECVCQWMIGMIYREQGNVDAAIDSFIRGLKARVKTPEQELALTYEIGDCYDTLRQGDQALYYFQRVARMAPAYDDPRGSAGERVRRLEPGPLPKPAAKAVGAETVDEFDAVLDDLLGGTKLP
jgi:tetratricopeptide (TPR) repeat protein